jgi:hypothetical protein
VVRISSLSEPAGATLALVAWMSRSWSTSPVCKPATMPVKSPATEMRPPAPVKTRLAAPASVRSSVAPGATCSVGRPASGAERVTVPDSARIVPGPSIGLA